MIKFSNITNEILKIKIKKVCLVELGLVPTNNSFVTINENNELDGSVVIDEKSYVFKNNRLV
jgi:hypothetical protein